MKDDDLGFEPIINDLGFEPMSMKPPVEGISQEQSDNSMIETAQDILLAVAQNATLDNKNALGAIYGKDPAEMTAMIAEADERSPIARPLTRVVSPTALGPLSRAVSPISRAAGVLGPSASKWARRAVEIGTSPTVEGAAIGYNASEENKGTNALIGGGIGALSHGLTTIIGKGIGIGKGAQTREAATGRGARQVAERGAHISPELSDKFLKSTKLYNDTTAEYVYDIASNKFKPTYKNVDPNWTPQQTVLSRIKDANTKLTEASNSILEEVPYRYTFDDVINSKTFNDSLKNSKGKMTKKIGRSVENKKFNEIKELIREEIEAVEGGATLSDIQDLKRLTSEEANYALNLDDNLSEQIYKKISRGFKDFVEEESAKFSKSLSSQIKELNRRMSNTIPKQYDLMRAIEAQKGTAGDLNITSVGLSPKLAATRGVSEASKQSSFKFKRANIASNLEDIPEYIKRPISSTLKRGAARGLMPSLLQPKDQGREPQSIPEQIMLRKLPRDSQFLIDNKELVLEKIRLQMPTMYEYVEHALTNESSNLPDVLPLIIEQVPQLFERDEYNRVDGKLIKAEDKARAIEDTMKRDDISNSDMVAILNRISKKGMM